MMILYANGYRRNNSNTVHVLNSLEIAMHSSKQTGWHATHDRMLNTNIRDLNQQPPSIQRDWIQSLRLTEASLMTLMNTVPRCFKMAPTRTPGTTKTREVWSRRGARGRLVITWKTWFQRVYGCRFLFTENRGKRNNFKISFLDILWVYFVYF